jgi:hypothetical protein
MKVNKCRMRKDREKDIRKEKRMEKKDIYKKEERGWRKNMLSKRIEERDV